KPSGTFFRVDLKYSRTGTVSLGLLKDDLYVVAYLGKNDKGKFVAYYFKGQINSAQLDTLFPEASGATNQKMLEYEENYAALEKAA
ncbi:ribosome-inactivating family protein, partial [Mycobacterium kansasii]